jgi:hypothetical protein
MKQTTRGKARSASAKSSSSGKHIVVAKLSGGVQLLKPKSKPKHFTTKQIRATIRQLRSSGAIGVKG